MAAPLVRPAATIGGLTVVSRVLGFARDVLSANLLGAGWVMDAFTIALLVPNLFRRLLGEGAMSSAFVPTFVRELEGPGPESARRLLGATTARLAVALAALVAVGYAATFVIPRLWPGEKAALTVELLRITLPYLLLVCLTAVFGAALNSLRHFAAPAVAPVLLNLLWIGGLAYGMWRLRDQPVRAVAVVAAVIVAGGVLQLALQYAVLARRRMLPARVLRHERLADVWRLFAPAVLGVALFQVNEVVDIAIAKTMIPWDGAVAALGYASHLYFLPLSVIGVALGTAALPELSRATQEEFRPYVLRALRVAILLSVPAGVGLLLLARPICEVLLRHGRFDPDAAARTAGALGMYACGLWAYVATHVLARAFHARRDTKTPFRVVAAMVALNLALNLALVGPLAEAGLALATAATGVVQAVCLLILLARRERVALGWDAMAALGRCLAAAVVMATVVSAAWARLDPMLAGRAARGAALAGTIVVGLIAYLVAARSLAAVEFRELVRRRRPA